MKTFLFSLAPTTLGVALIALGLLMSPVRSQAAPTEISKVPLLTSKTAKPNVMLLMDTSNSMTWTHMPDPMEKSGLKQRIGYKSHFCNSIYYNPGITYKTPRNADGTHLPIPTFGAAPYDYYLVPATTVNLATSFQAHDDNTVFSPLEVLADAPKPAYYFRFTPSATVTKPTAAACDMQEPANNSTSTLNIAGGGGTWKRIIVGATSGAGNSDERQNFAIWYTYYRTRILMAKSAIGTAFAPLIDDKRVGFVTVQPAVNGSVSPSRYLRIDDFAPDHKQDFYSKLFSQIPAGSSPAREGLARVGRHYGGKTDLINSGMNQDPVQVSCQSNYTVLMTDGYWNAHQETNPHNGAYALDGITQVGQQDGTLTPDTGLVPYGVYDKSVTSTGNTKVVSRTPEYQAGNCNYPSTGRYTRVVTESKIQNQTTTTTAAAVTPGAYEKRIHSYSIRTQDVTRTRTLRTVTTYRLRSTWGEVTQADESKVAVASCTAGMSNCVTRTYGPVNVASCPATLPPLAYGDPVCTGPHQLSAAWVASCVPSAAGAVQTITCAAPVTESVTLSACPSSNSTRICASTPPVTTASPLCTPGTTFNGTTTTTCSMTSNWVSVGSCTPGPDCRAICVPSPANNYCASVTTVTIGNSCTPSPTVSCSTVTTPTVVDPATCVHDPVPSPGNGWMGTSCNAVTSNAVPVASCTPAPATGPDWVETLCNAATPTPGLRLQTRTRTNEQITYTGGTVVDLPASYNSWDWASGSSCVAHALFPPLPVAETIVDPPIVTTASQTGGSINSLADVAQYYYATDLRPTMANDVRPTGSRWNDDKVTHQHMTTFVIGLGVSGTKTYDPDYNTAVTGDFAAIRNGTGSWPVWPDPAVNFSANYVLYHNPKSIDDFWHTAVNGRGQYFSANDPDAVALGLKNVFATIEAAEQAGTAVILSDNAGATAGGLNFRTTFTSSTWTGNLIAQDGTGTDVWNAGNKLAGQVAADCDRRNIYVRNALLPRKLAEFALNTRKCGNADLITGLTTAQRAHFDASALSHYAAMTDGTNGTANQRDQASRASLVNYLRGQTQHEEFLSGASGKLYRKRDSRLGDIIGSSPVYVGAPYFTYADPGYAAFKSDSANAARRGMVYVGANDGMLHAFYASDGLQATEAGQEAWAYIPSAVLPKLHKLANYDYSTNHDLFVDGAPVIGDVYDGTAWKTILVGGLGAGGKGYFALNITNPTAPESLWEFDTNNVPELGLSMGKPMIIKLASGRWVVMLTSGYNSGGTGKLYILDAVTGALLETLDTGVGSAANPSGLTHLTAWVDARATNFTAKRVYGGDLFGNIWRFDVNDNIPPSGLGAAKLGVARDHSGTPQPITTPPELRINKGVQYVYVGTGQLLGQGDLTRTQLQSVYGIRDPLNGSNPVYPDLRGVLKPLKTDAELNVVCAVASCPEEPAGWVVDLSVSGERVNIRPGLLGDWLVVVTNRPLPNPPSCSSTMESRLYFINPLAGESAEPGRSFAGAAVGLTHVHPPSGAGPGGGREKIWLRFADGRREIIEPPPAPGVPKVFKRASWRRIAPVVP